MHIPYVSIHSVDALIDNLKFSTILIQKMKENVSKALTGSVYIRVTLL